MKYAVIESETGKSGHRERQIGEPHASQEAAQAWLERNIRGDGKRAYSVRPVMA